MNESEALEAILNFETRTPSGQGSFTVSYVDGWIVCTTPNDNHIKFNNSATNTNKDSGILLKSIQFLHEAGPNGIRIGTSLNAPEPGTFEEFLRPFGNVHKLGSYFPSVLERIGVAEIIRNQGPLRIRIHELHLAL